MIKEYPYIIGHFRVAPKPLFQSEAMCEAIDMKMTRYSHANETLFTRKVLFFNLVLKMRVFGTRKWPIDVGGVMVI